ncbi:MAG: glycine cleavage system protein GcvH [Deltaproteobacteria bacterium]|nr:glycine cleavage system protein GcvH [Deltaproteobacteria bacterium]
MSSPADLYYSKDHEWARLEGDVVTVGVTDHAQDALGDVVFVELPELDRGLIAHETFGVVESVKAVNDLYSPCEGVVVEVNEALNDTPELINGAPYAQGWILKLKVSGPEALSHLMSASEYDEYLETLG